MVIIGITWLFIVGLLIGGTLGWVLRDICEGASRRCEDESTIAHLDNRADEMSEEPKKEEVSVK